MRCEKHFDMNPQRMGWLAPLRHNKSPDDDVFLSVRGTESLAVWMVETLR